MSEGQGAGLLARFDAARPLVEAARSLREAGYRRLDACTPLPLEELDSLIPVSTLGVKLCMLFGGLLGAAGGYFMQWYSAVISYPFNSGGRPLHSWPAFLVTTFELGILGAALAGFFGMLAFNRLPRLHHPLFEAHDFDLASRDKFFLLVEAEDGKFDPDETARLLQSLGAREVVSVAP